ncbi:unnamed protein product [Closterium sp. Naga37s-1]|nr:unnamed protein product [Closterium sp. Naga37s-1]
MGEANGEMNDGWSAMRDGMMPPSCPLFTSFPICLLLCLLQCNCVNPPSGSFRPVLPASDFFRPAALSAHFLLFRPAVTLPSFHCYFHFSTPSSATVPLPPYPPPPSSPPPPPLPPPVLPPFLPPAPSHWARPISHGSDDCSGHAAARCSSSTRAVFCHHYSWNAAVGDGRDPHASQSMGASAGLGCDGWADEAEECNQAPRGMSCSLPPTTASLLLDQCFLFFFPTSRHSWSCMIPMPLHVPLLVVILLSVSLPSPLLPFLFDSGHAAVTWNLPSAAQPHGVCEAVMASKAGTHELSEAMEMRVRALGVQLEETKKELAAAKGELEEAERRRVANMEERDRNLVAVQGEVIAVKGELNAMRGQIHEYIDAMEEQRELRGESRKEECEIRAELAREREEERGAGSGLATCHGGIDCPESMAEDTRYESEC